MGKERRGSAVGLGRAVLPLSPLSPPPLCRILGEAPRGGERSFQPEPPGEGASSQEGGKGELLKRGAKNVLAGLDVCTRSGLLLRCSMQRVCILPTSSGRGAMGSSVGVRAGREMELDPV